MRVVAGIARGRRLKEPEDQRVRPTTDKVKESMFNIIQMQIPGSEVLDMFGGTGQLSIEALSRGADSAVIIDSHPKSVRLIRENLKIAGFENSAEVITADALLYIKSGKKYDIVFMDPPYDTDLLEKSLKNAFEFDILKDNGIIICESKVEKVLSYPSEPYELYREYRYGQIKLTVFKKITADE